MIKLVIRLLWTMLFFDTANELVNSFIVALMC